MPNWKKVITSGSDASLNTLTVSNGITGSLEGTSSYALTASLLLGTIESASYALTASYALNGGGGSGAGFPFTGSAEITGSLIVTGSILSTDGFTGSLLGTASYSNKSLSSSYAETASYANDFTILGSITSVNYIDFNTGSAAPAWKSGRVYWNNIDSCLDVYNAEADVTLQVGQENWTRIRNNTGVTIANGSVVRLDGSQGDVPTAVLAQSIAVSGSVNVDNQILGLATHNIEANSFGYVTTQGLVRGLNTNAFIEGETLYVSTTAGLLTGTAPEAPFEIIPVGVCVKASPGGSGIIYVAVQEPIDFSDLSSVRVQGNYAYGDLWTYVQSGSYGVWTHTNQLSGSYGLTGSLSVTNGGVTGSLFGTASNALTASYLNTLNQNVIVNGNVSINGTASIAYLNVAYESASIIYSSGSNQFGDATNDTQTLIGRTIVSGSLEVTGSANLPNITGSLFGTASWASNATTASYVLNAVSSSFASTASFVNPLNQNVILTGSLTISGSATGSVFSVSASYLDFDFDSFLFSGSTIFQSALDATQAVSTFGTASITFGNITGSFTGSLSGSLFGTGSWAVSSSRTVSASRADSALSSSFASTASFVNRLVQTFTVSGSSLLTGSLTLVGPLTMNGALTATGSALMTGSLTITGRQTLTGSFSVLNSESVQNINQGLTHPATTGSRIFQTTIAPVFTNNSPNQTSTALRLLPTFTGSFSGSNTQNLIVDFGASNVGSQFTVNDVTSGSIYMVNDVSGLPIIEATSNWDVNIYDYPNVVLKKTGSLVNISGSLNIRPGGITSSQTTSSLTFTIPTGSSTQNYNVGITKYRSFSYLTTTRPIYQDNYILLGYDSSGTDPELTVLTDPASGRVQCHVFSSTAATTVTSDINVASGIVDIYPTGMGSDMRLDITISAGSDANYPFYRITMFRSNTTYGGNISVLVERFFVNQ